MRRRRFRAERKLEKLRMKRGNLLDERTSLLTEPAAIERVAREQYGFVAPGEYPMELRSSSSEKGEPEISVHVPSDGWDWILGRGNYPWRLPVLVFFLGAIVLGSSGVIEQVNMHSEDTS